jgi:thiamine kinase-like enzyme
MTKHSASLHVRKETVTKRFKKKKDKDFIKFIKELSVYIAADKKNLDYIPKLISYSYTKRSITTEKIKGYDLGTIPEADFEKREAFLPKINEILKRFKKDLNLYHNDILYRNFVYEPKTKKLYIVDFESVSLERLSTEPKDFIEINIKKKGIGIDKSKKNKVKTKKKK